jgi:hypothetical protein
MTKLPAGRVISSFEELYKNCGSDVSQGQKWPCRHLNHSYLNFLPRKTNGVPSRNFVEKNVLCEKGDEITRFDGTALHKKLYPVHDF